MIKMKHSVMVEGKAVAVHERTIYEDKKKADKTAYIHQDAQGSTSMVTTNTQAIAFKNEFTPFGEEISSLDNKTLKKEDFRGYTGHKMVGTSGVIDMNARMYDPFIARFTSPDTIIPDFSNPMAYNRYAYVYGNPVKYIDPDGHCPWLFLAGVAIFTVSATSDNTTVQAVGMTIGSLMMSGGAEMLVGKGAVFAQGATVGFTSGFIVSGGNIGESLKGGALGGLGAQLSNAIGHHLGFSDGSIGQTFAHGVSQGTISHLRGGDFRSGFIGGVLSKASGGVMEHLGLFQGDSTMDVMGGTAVSMVVGGITSDAAGGSFMDGALSAMAVHLWNDGLSWVIGKGVGYESKNTLSHREMNSSGRRIITAGIVGGTSGTVGGCTAGLPAAGIGCLPGAIAGGIVGSSVGLLNATAIEMSGWGQVIEDSIGIGLATTQGYVEYKYKKMRN